MERDQIAAKIRSFIVEHSNLEDDSVIGDDMNLFEAGVLDSLAAVSLLGFCATDFGCAIDMSELSEENFGSLRAIAAFIHGKLTAGSPSQDRS